MFQKKYIQVPERRFKQATISEVAFNSEKHEACGKTIKEALDRLSELCRCHQRPSPEPTPEYDGAYHCGMVAVKYFTKTKSRYNPVWFSRKNDMVVVTVYFNH